MLMTVIPRTVKRTVYKSLSLDGKSPKKKLELATITTSKIINNTQMQYAGHFRFSFIFRTPLVSYYYV